MLRIKSGIVKAVSRPRTTCAQASERQGTHINHTGIIPLYPPTCMRRHTGICQPYLHAHKAKRLLTLLNCALMLLAAFAAVHVAATHHLSSRRILGQFTRQHLLM
jgi:hypothetical protein